MKTLGISIFGLAFMLSGCATRLYNPNGKILASFGGRYATLHYAGAGVVFDATQMSHATETRAAGSMAGTLGSTLTTAIAGGAAGL